MKPHGLLPSTTDARILPSQAFYKSGSSYRTTKKKEKLKPKLDDTFARLENDINERKDEILQQNASKFYLQTPTKVNQENNKIERQNISTPVPVKAPQIPPVKLNDDFSREPTNSIKSSKVKNEMPNILTEGNQSLGSHFSGEMF